MWLVKKHNSTIFHQTQKRGLFASISMNLLTKGISSRGGASVRKRKSESSGPGADPKVQRGKRNGAT